METDFLASANHFRTLLSLIASFFRLMEAYLLTSPTFWLVKADSLANVSHFLSIFQIFEMHF